MELVKREHADKKKKPTWDELASRWGSAPPTAYGGIDIIESMYEQYRQRQLTPSQIERFEQAIREILK